MAGCMYVLRNTIEKSILIDKLESFAQRNEIGVMHPPVNLLVEYNAVRLETFDFAFELTDSFDIDSADYLLSYDGCRINGKTATRPLYQRLLLLQEILSICIPFADAIEIYLGEDNPYLPDYVVFQTEYTNLADTIYEEFQKDDWSPFLPCIKICVQGRNTNRTEDGLREPG